MRLRTSGTGVGRQSDIKVFRSLIKWRYKATKADKAWPGCQMEPKGNRFFLFLGGADSEGVTSKLKTSEIEYRKKMLHSSPDNWKDILKLMKMPSLAGVAVSFPASSMTIAVSRDYIDLTRQIFSLLKDKPHIIFVHETFFRGPIEDEYEYYSFGHIGQSERRAITALFDEFGLQLTPYKTNAEMSVLASEFVDAHGSNLAFRMYIPHDRMWSNETGSIIALFRDYLTKVSGLRVRQEQHSTPLGTVYEIFAEEAATSLTLQDEFREFSLLLDTTIVDPEAARSVLESKNVNAREVISIVDRYAKEARRLQVDLRQDRERKVLSIRHRLEAELVDHVHSSADWDCINSVINAAIPPLEGVSAAVGLLPAPAKSGTKLTVNVNPQIIQTVNGVVARELYGNQSFGADLSEVLRVIQEHGKADVLQLTSAVYEIEDPEIRSEKKLTALQRLKSFVYQAGTKIPDVALGVLQAYIESKMGLS